MIAEFEILKWLKGIIVTLELTIVSLLIGALIGGGMSLLSMSPKKILNKPIDLIIFIIKGTPMLVQIFIIYYGIGYLGSSKEGFFWNALKSPFFCATSFLAINSAAYMSSLIESAIKSIPKGQYLSARALGMTKFQAYKNIIIPQIIKAMLPAYSNEAVILLKSTSLASGITLMDIMGVANRTIAQTYNVGQTLIIVALIYIILNIILSKTIEKIGAS
ncbi:MAG: ABC transporter permease subunit [Bacteroidetes bacterium]|nr:ABC transporter permease subunit [Bacteroidota bacterium]